jgi:hypothetical protein
MPLHRTVLEFSWNAALAFTTIYCLPRGLISTRPTKDIRMVQIMLDSVSSMGMVLNKILKWQLNIPNSLLIRAIPKQNSTFTAAFACPADGNHPIALPRSFRIYHRFIVCLTISVTSLTIQNRWTMMAIGYLVPLSD